MGELVRYGSLLNPYEPGVLVDFYGNPIGTGLGPSVLSVLEFGADPTGTFDSTAAFNAAFAALPQIPVTNNGHSFTTPYGTVTGGGRFIVNQIGTLNPWGPFVLFDGLGFTFLDDWNPNSATYGISLNNPNGFPGIIPPIQAGPQMQYWTGGIVNTIIDGTHTATACAAIIAGGGEYCRIKHCIIQNYASNGGSVGLYLAGLGNPTTPSHAVGWMESWDIDIQTINCDNAVVFDGKGPNGTPTAQNSQSQGRLWLRLNAWPGQKGIVVQNGAWLYNSQIYMTGVMYRGTASQAGAALTVNGVASLSGSPNTAIENTHIDIRLEMDQAAGDAGNTKPRTCILDTANSAYINACEGVWMFQGFAATWSGIQPGASVLNGPPNNPATGNPYWTFWGLSIGDIQMTTSGQLTLLAGAAGT